MSGESEDSVATEKPKLVVWCDDAEAAAPLVDSLGQRFSVTVQESLSAFAARLEDMSDARGLLLYLSPVEALCRAMLAETCPSAALSAWQEWADGILEQNRRDRRRVRLVEINAARVNPGKFRQHFHLPEMTGAELTELPQQDPMLTLIAHHVLREDLQAQRLHGEIEAASLDCGGKTSAAAGTPNAAFLAYHDLRRTQQKAELLEEQNRLALEELSALSAQKKELEAAERDREKAHKEADLLQAQIKVMKQEIDTLTASRQRLDQRLEQMSQGLESSQAQLSTITGERDRMRREADETARRLAAAEETLREVEAHRDRLNRRIKGKERSLAAAGETLREIEAQRDHLAARLDKVQAERQAALQEVSAGSAELQRILSSKSFRLTAPLRRLRALLSSGGPA